MIVTGWIIAVLIDTCVNCTIICHSLNSVNLLLREHSILSRYNRYVILYLSFFFQQFVRKFSSNIELTFRNLVSSFVSNGFISVVSIIYIYVCMFELLGL